MCNDRMEKVRDGREQHTESKLPPSFSHQKWENVNSVATDWDFGGLQKPRASPCDLER